MSGFLQITAGQLVLPGGSVVPLQLGALVVLLFAATAVDIRERRIPNWLVATGMAGAIAFHTLSPQGEGTAFALSGLAVGIATLLPMYVMRVMGAGDVKLMGMTGAFIGMYGVLGAVLASMVAGGILALSVAAGKRMLPQLLANLRDLMAYHHIRYITRCMRDAMPAAPSVGKMPYAVAITAGTLAQLTFLHL